MQLLKRWFPFIKWLWLLLVLITAGWYIQQNFDSIADELRSLPLWRLVISGALLVIGRLFIIIHATFIVREKQPSITHADMFYIISFSELGKYLPGGVWHFVGRTAYYRKIGLSLEDASRTLILELTWLVMSAVCLGGALLVSMENIPIAGFIVLLWGIALTISQWRKSKRIQFASIGYLMLVQAIIWLSIGCSYGILLPALSAGNWIFVVGAFTISWVIGFLMIIAPGGLGTREVALATLTVSLAPISTTIVLASIHRLVWISVEALLAVVAMLTGGIDER